MTPRVSLSVAAAVRRRAGLALGRELVRLARRVLAAAGRVDAELSIALVGDREIRSLNRRYAGEDHATDVLSFAQAEGPAGPPGGDSPLLGDVVISVDTAGRQARAAGQEPLEEIFHLLVHGIAHLCGYDHAGKRAERVMFDFERRLREAARGAGPVRVVRARVRPGGRASGSRAPAAGRRTPLRGIGRRR